MKKFLSVRDVKQLPKDSDFYVMGLVSKFTRRKDRNDNPFWEMTISDTSGDLEGKVWPAAVTLHHAYTGGLLEHSVSVAIGARDMARHYADFMIPVNMDLVIAGALLHDIGKLEAYTINPVPQVTPTGNAIEHITLGYSMFMRLAEAEHLDSGLTLALGHILVSHHGKREYGSPVLPVTPEAFIVNAADDADFKLSYWKAQIDALNIQSEVTDYLPAIDRRLWRGIAPK